MRGVAVGIDIGTTSVTAVATRRERGGKIGIVGVGSAASDGIRKGSIVDVEAAAHALKLALHEVSRSSGFPVRRAYVAVGGSHLGSFVVRGAIAISRADGEITEDDVTRVVRAAEGMIPRNPNREVIHLIPREFKVDGQGGITDPIGMVGMKLEVEALVIDGSRPILQNLIKCCELAGVVIEDWASSILVASEILLTKKQRELGTILLDLGAGTSDFAVFEEGQVIDVGSFPIGGSHITSDVAIGFRAPVAAAEEIKIRYAELHPADRLGRRENIAMRDFVGGDDSVFAVRDLMDIVSARLIDIFELTTKALRRIGRAGLLPGGVVLTGGVADIQGIQNLARRELKLPVEVAKAVAVDEFGDVVPPRLAVPLGLILWQSREMDKGFGQSRGWGQAGEWFWRWLRSFVP